MQHNFAPCLRVSPRAHLLLVLGPVAPPLAARLGSSSTLCGLMSLCASGGVSSCMACTPAQTCTSRITTEPVPTASMAHAAPRLNRQKTQHTQVAPAGTHAGPRRWAATAAPPPAARRALPRTLRCKVETGGTPPADAASTSVILHVPAHCRAVVGCIKPARVRNIGGAARRGVPTSASDTGAPAAREWHLSSCSRRRVDRHQRRSQ